MSINTEGKAESPNVEINTKHIKDGNGIFVVDTGAELNLIKRRKVKTGVSINFQIKYHLFGITQQGVKTAGEVYLDINGVFCPFQLVPNTFPIKCDGMLGMPFLTYSVIDLQTKIIKHTLGNFPFSTPPKSRKLLLKARTKQLVTLSVTNTKISEGYLPLVPTGSDVYLGESLVTVINGGVNVYCFNVSTKDIELSVSPISLEEIEFLDYNSSFVRRIASDKEPLNTLNTRFEKLIATLNLTN